MIGKGEGKEDIEYGREDAVYGKRRTGNREEKTV